MGPEGLLVLGQPRAVLSDVKSRLPLGMADADF